MFRIILRFRYAAIAAVLGLTAFFALQLPKLHLDPDTEAYVPERHPIRVFWTEAKDSFGIGREIVVAVRAEGDHGVFTPAILGGVAELTEAIKELDSVIPSAVSSISDSEAIVGTEDGLDVEPFFEEPPTTAEEAREVREKVFANEVFLDRLISRDATIAAIIVRIYEAYERDPIKVYDDIAALVAGTSIPGADILIGGNPAVESVFGKQMAADLANLIPAALFVVITILYVCFASIPVNRFALRMAIALTAVTVIRFAVGSSMGPLQVTAISAAAVMLTARGVLLPATVVVMSVVWTWGAQALAGVPVYIAGTLVPPLLLAIGCAFGVHVMERYFEKAKTNADPETVVLATMEELWRPIFLTSVTTAIGFGSLALGSMTVYRVFGLTTAFGILVAMLVSFALLPPVLSLMPVPKTSPGGRSLAVIPGLLVRMAGGLERHRDVTMLTGGVLMCGLVYAAATGLRVDYSWVESLEAGTPVLEADRILRTRHGGTMPLNIILRSGEPGGVKDPRLLEGIDAALAEIAAHPEVGDTRSIAEYIKRLNEAMNEDRPEELRIPDSRELVAQYLLMYTMSGDPSELDDMIDYEYASANAAILLRTDRLAVMREVIALAEEALDKHVRPLGVTTTATGTAIVQKTVLDMILESQVYSLTAASLLVFTFMALVFRSLRDSLICMVPPVFTGVANFGGMALLDIPLGPGEAMISAIALGIGIDYSIHLMARLRDVVEEGLSVYDGIIEAMRTTGRAILFNGVVVVAGFSTLALSKSPSNVSFGVLIATNIGISCISALVFLPAALTSLFHLRLVRERYEPVRIGGKLVKARIARDLGLSEN